jgi:hypothetical protein
MHEETRINLTKRASTIEDGGNIKQITYKIKLISHIKKLQETS